MPGVHSLVATLGTSPNTVLEAVRTLEREGLLESQGPGRSSRIVIPEGMRPPGLRIKILLYDKIDVSVGYMIELKHQLLESGHNASFSDKSLLDFQMNADRVVRYVNKSDAEAWVVLGGSLSILEWFSLQPFPTFALFGRMREVAMAGLVVDRTQAMTSAVQRLVSLGHRRIVMLVREDHRLPHPSMFVLRFLELLQAQGIPTGPYNVPDWEANADGLCKCLNSLFQHTPPTAIIFDELHVFAAARLHLVENGITSPKDVSIICLDPDPIHSWSKSPVSHFYWDIERMIRRTVQWADNAACGKQDRRKTFIKASFVEGGTIGPVPKTPLRIESAQ